MSKQIRKISDMAAGKFQGKFRLPLTIFSVFFVIGIIVDIFFEWFMCNVVKGRSDVFYYRIPLGFTFWFLCPAPEEGGWWYMPNPDDPETKIDARQTLAIDDLVLVILTFAILLIWKMKFIHRVAAALGFFAGWYVSSMWISMHIQARLPKLTEEEAMLAAASKNLGASNPHPNFGGLI